MLPSEHKKFTHFSPLVVLTTFGLLVGVFITIIGAQQSTETRSRAAIQLGNYNGTLTGNGHIVAGSVAGDVIGNYNTIAFSVSGCVKGDYNTIGGKVYGAVSGSGNRVDGGVGSGPCVSSQTSTTAPTANTVTLTPIADATVFQNSPSNNHGLKPELQVENDPSDGGVDYVYMKFDLSAYAGKTITSAKLRLRTMNDSDADSNGTVYVNWVTNTSWTETGITYNNKPAISSTVLGSAKPSAPNTTYEFSLSTAQLVSALGGQASIALTSLSDDAASFNSKEVSSGKPELILTLAASTASTSTPIPPTAAPTVTKTPTPTPSPTKTPTPTPIQSVPTSTPTSIVTVAPTTPVATSTLIPTTAPEEGTTSVVVNLMLHGIGEGGDAVNPNSQGNMNPLHPQRTVSVDVYNAQNQLVATKQGIITFNTASGAFTGNISLGNTITTGAHTIRIKVDQYLRGIVAGIQMLNAGQTASLPSLTLTAGDVNNDNAINIVDYNIIVGCYSDLLPPVSCNDVNKLRADLNDDDKVNQFDYNLFIRELTNLGGQ